MSRHATKLKMLGGLTGLLVSASCVWVGEGIPCNTSANCPTGLSCDASTCIDGPDVLEEDIPQEQDPELGMNNGISMEAEDVPPPILEDPDPDVGTPPTIEATHSVFAEEGELEIPLTITEVDGDGYALRVVTLPRHATARVDGEALFILPSPGFQGTDAVEVEVRDLDGATTTRLTYVIVPTDPAMARIVVDGNISDQPARVAIDADAFLRTAVPLRFVDDDGTPIDVRIHNLGGELQQMWIPGGVETLYAVPGAPADESLWDNYRAVFHFDDNNASAIGGLEATPMGGSAVAGLLGSARSLDGITDWIDLGANLDTLRGVEGAYLSAWVRPSVPLGTSSVLVAFSKGDDENLSRAQVSIDAIGRVRVYATSLDSASTWQQETVDAGVLPLYAWTWIAAVIDVENDEMELYVDGVQQPLRTRNNDNPGLPGDRTSETNSLRAAIGSQDDGSAERFGGQIDEVRVAARVPGPAEVWAEYEAMTAPVVREAGVVETHNAVATGSGTLSMPMPDNGDDIWLLFVSTDDESAMSVVRSTGPTWLPLADGCAPSGRLKAFWARGTSQGELELELEGGGAFVAQLLAFKGALQGQPVGVHAKTTCDAARLSFAVTEGAPRTTVVSARVEGLVVNTAVSHVVGDNETFLDDDLGVVQVPHGAVAVELR